MASEMSQHGAIEPESVQTGGREAVTALGIVTVNWNGWPDTIECLEAIFKMREFLGPVVIVDNGSEDGSIERIIEWAGGRLCAVPQNRNPEIERLVIPPAAKPIAVQVLETPWTGGPRGVHDESVRLIVIRAGENLGFAAANNLGIHFLLASPSIDLIWFVNNDALPREDAFLEIAAAAGPPDEPLMSGSVLMEYYSPMTIQALGGRFASYSGVSGNLMAGMHRDDLAILDQRVAVDYPVGAALLVNRTFVTRYGLMCEDYFLYFEEIDWALRMKRHRRAYVNPRSVVFHKGGAATAAGRIASTRSLLADYYMLRNRLLVTRRVSFMAFLSCALLSPGAIVLRLFRKRPGLFLNAIRAVTDGLLGHSGRRSR